MNNMFDIETILTKLNKLKQLIKNNEDYKNLVDDIIKYSTLIIVINLLFYLSKSNTSFFNSVFIDLELFIIIGLSSYWLVVNKLISF